jgi:serine/threonine protein kinase/Tfp pilus assembly protein PilF
MATQCPKCKADNPDESKFCNECGLQLDSIDQMPAPPTQTLEVPKQELTRGTVFANRYEIIEELGKGGMGRVYRVEDTKLKQEVALKLIKPEIAKDTKTIERFRNELKFARDIRHKNVCGMYDLGETEGAYFITMEYVRGEDLKSLIRKMGQLSSGQVISIAKQVCDGLVEAHRLEVVHRDLKPQNIMIDTEGNTRIMDFGIARSLEAKRITGAGVMIGTPEYMSPEQVEGKEVDQRSDIYSLGVILYEMVTGKVPFEGDTPFTIGMKHKGEVPQNPKELNTQISDDLNRVILRCLEKEKEKRYQSAGDVRSELENIEKGIPTTERIVPERKPLTSREITVTFGLKKLFIPALVVAALVIAAIVIWQLLPKKEAISLPPDIPSIAVLPFEDLSQEKDQESFCDGMTEDIITKLTKLKGLKVISRDSVMYYKNSEKGHQKIGQELNVDTILHGSVQKENNEIRVVAKLTNLEDNSYLWADSFARPLKDVFNIQSEIALKIASYLEIKLSSEDTKQIEKKPTENLEAYNLYLHGRFLWKKRGKRNIAKSIEYLEQAIEKDPNFALAYAGLADSYLLIARRSTDAEASMAKEATLKALELDITLAEAHTSLAELLLDYEWDFEGAKRKFEHAILLNPGYATAHHWYSRYFWWMGMIDEAIIEMKLAHELDPLSFATAKNLGSFYGIVGHYDQAIETLNKVIEIDPNFQQVHEGFGWAYLSKGMFHEAMEEFQKEFGPNSLKAEYWRLIISAMQGEKNKVRKRIEEMNKKMDLESLASPFEIACLWAEVGDADQVFRWLENAYKSRDQNMILLQITPTPALDDYRSDSRYEKLLKKMGLKK